MIDACSALIYRSSPILRCSVIFSAVFNHRWTIGWEFFRVLYTGFTGLKSLGPLKVKLLISAMISPWDGSNSSPNRLKIATKKQILGAEVKSTQPALSQPTPCAHAFSVKLTHLCKANPVWAKHHVHTTKHGFTWTCGICTKHCAHWVNLIIILKKLHISNVEHHGHTIKHSFSWTC